MSSIYKITNSINGKIYIGLTTKTITHRKYRHIASFKKLNTYLAKAVRKHGIDNFKFETIDSGNFTKEELINLEKHYIKLYNSNNPTIGYNMTEGGETITYSRTPEMRRKISETLKGHSYNKGISKSQEHRQKLSKATSTFYKNGGTLPNWKKCSIYDMEGNKINEFVSLTEAANYLKIDKATLRKISKNLKTRINYNIKVEIQ